MKKRLFALVIVLTMLMSFVPVMVSAATSGTCGYNLTWTLDDDGTLTISGTGDMWDYYMPWYSSSESIKTVVIEDGVTSIGDSAFSDCDSLMSVTILDSVTSIGEDAFSYCSSLTSVIIPDSVTSIGEYTFCRCDNLTEINVAAENSKYCSEDGILFNKNKTMLICCPAGKSGAYAIPDRDCDTIGLNQ